VLIYGAGGVRLVAVTSPTHGHRLRGLRRKVKRGGSIRSFAVSRDKRTLLIARELGSFEIWDLTTGTRQYTGGCTEHGEIPPALAPDGRHLAYFDGDDVAVEDVHALRGLPWCRSPQAPGARRPLGKFTGLAAAIAFSPDGDTVATSSNDGTVMLWNAGRPSNTIPTVAGVTRLDFGSARSLVAIGMYSIGTKSKNGVYFFDTHTGRRYGFVPGPRDASFNRDGRLFATGAGAVPAWWNILSRKRVGQLPPADRRGMISFGVRLSPDARFLTVKDQSRHRLGKERAELGPLVLHVWDLTNRSRPRLVATLRLGPAGFYVSETSDNVAFAPHGAPVIAFALEDKNHNHRVVFWDVEKKATLWQTPPVPGSIGALAYSATASVIAVSSSNGIDVWNTATRRRVATLSSPSGEFGPVSLAFSPDGKILAAGFQNDVRLWETKSYDVLGDLHNENTDDAQVAFIGNRRLAVNDDASFVTLWNLDADMLRDRVCGLIQRDFTSVERTRFFPGRPADEVPDSCPN
jgi:WD40 repeat protein